MTSMLGPTNQIEIYRGSSKTFELVVVDSEDAPVDLTAGRVVLSVKCSLSEDAPKIQKDSAAGVSQIEITQPAAGVAEIKFVPSDTQTMNIGEYIFDVWVVLAGGVRGPVITPSPFIVLAGVTVIP